MTLGASQEWSRRHGLADLAGAARHRHRATSRTPSPRAPACSPAAGTGPTSGRTSSSPPSSRASRPTWSASARRPSARSSRSTASTARTRRSSAPTTGTTASTPRSAPATPRAAGRWPAASACGTVNVNEAYGATFGSLGAPMGGMRESGLGRRQGAEGIHRYTEAQSVATQRLVPIAPMFGHVGGDQRQGDDRPRCGCSTSWAAHDRLPCPSTTTSWSSDRGSAGRSSALRLTEKGYTVGVLEAGARFEDDELPETPWRPEASSSSCPQLGLLRHPAHRHGQGLLDPRRAPASAAARSSTPTRSTSRWTRSTRTRSGRTSPTGSPSSRPTTTRPSGCWASSSTPRTTPADVVMKKVADEMGVGDTFHPTPVGVFFGGPGQAEGETVADPFFGGAGPDRGAPASTAARA